MEYTLTEAAQATALSRPTIFRAIKTGKLSARREADKSYRIDASELARVFPTISVNKPDVTARHDEKRAEQAETAQPIGPDTALLQLQVHLLEQQVVRERQIAEQVRELADRERETFQETVADLRKRLDRSEERVLALTVERVVSAPPAPSLTVTEPAVASVQPNPWAGVLARLFGRA
ncbi:hypothetical protein FHG66_20805 [Rubellimicrobium rubrum]|uniref:Helix-turn-helix domain-containing protein n=1 Tax=Rubellimicrobium rubrum TaxID=2585369 RepID=A0A5C4MHJ4_9RHOB|nr:hypothetical protein [Rubellimicrobium rubrum]TNC43796.1 hypothetical protein FHG66_20805 [Rubellimicrobium rubrum]